LDTGYIEHSRTRSGGLVVATSLAVALLSVAVGFVAVPAWQSAQRVPLDTPTPTPGAAAASFDPTRAVILSPDLDRSAALIWLSEDRLTLSLTHQYLQSYVETLGIWFMPPHGNWTRIGTVSKTEQVAVFTLTKPVSPESRMAIVLEGDGSEPGLILLSALLR